MTQPTLALYFGNRGFFPEKLVAEARREMQAALGRLGMGSLVLDEAATRFGAVETAEEGRRFAAFLAAHRGQFDGVVLSLPNFGDENGAVAALQDCGVPILVQAYPDEIGRMCFEDRRDAFCGKFSIVDVFFQNRIPFTAWRPHVAHPGSPVFAEQLSWFGAVCRVVGGLRRTTIGAIGARTTAFKTVRFDEVALQKHGVTVESLDLSEVFARVAGSGQEPTLRKKHERLAAHELDRVRERSRRWRGSASCSTI
jgi:L-fucose isomerase-like protein